MRRFRRSVLGVVIVAVIAMTMSGFGVDFAANRGKPYAIKVGDSEISLERYSQVRRSIDSRYRQMFGANTNEFLKSLGIDTAQQAIDTAIDAELLLQLAKQLGLEASDKSVQEMLVKDLFQGQFDKERYKSFLASQGLTPQQFEDNLKQDILRRQISNIFEDSAKPSRREARAQLAKDKTAYSFIVAKISANDLLPQTGEPEAAEVEKIYDQNLTDHQSPAKVSYKFVQISPQDYNSKVEVAEEDIEIEYSDNMASYKTDPQIRYSQIFLQFNSKDSENKKGEIRKKSMELLEKLKNGSKFEDLARASSQDIGSALKGGDAGWFNKSDLNPELAEKLAKLDLSAVSDPIETSTGIYLLRLDDKKEPQQKELSEVKDQIVAKIRDREAPAIMALEMQQIYEKWSKNELTIDQIVQEHALPQALEVLDYDASRDISPALSGLTTKVIANVTNKKQLLEIADKQVLVEVQNYTEEAIKPLDQVRDEIIKKLKNDKAKVLAKQKAEEAKAALVAAEAKDFIQKAKSLGMQTEEVLEQTRTSAKGILAEASVRNKAFSAQVAPAVIDQVFENIDSFAIIQVSNIKQASSEDIDKALDASLQGFTRENEELALESYLAKAKAATKIDIQPSLLNN